MIWLLACSTPAPVETRFVRGGVLSDGVFEPRAWSPGDSVGGVTAPQVPECVPLFHVELGDMAKGAVLGAPPPGAALAWSPDGKTLAIGSARGDLLLVEAATGVQTARRSFAEASVKRVAWSADGATLYAAEQSPDAFLYALEVPTLKTRWQRRLADELETSPLPAEDDIYGRYGLPAAMSVQVVPAGLLVAGAHGWAGPDGKRRNLGRLWLLDARGEVLHAWPPEGPADAVILFPSIYGDRVLAGVSRSADGPPPTNVPVGGLVELDLATLAPRWTTTFPALKPLFNEVFLWEAVVAGQGFAFAGLGDGRAFLFDDSGAMKALLTPGVPVTRAGVPIAVGVGFATARGDTIWFETTSTNIPWGSADPMARPPEAHPAQYSVHAVQSDGTLKWNRSYEHALDGIVASPDGTTLMLGASTRGTDTRTDLFGVVLVRSADGEIVTTCSTEGPVDFRPAWAPDSGAVAVTEAPFLHEGAVRGGYRVTVFR